MRLIVNLSKKKTGTSFIHNIFRYNQKKIENVYTPLIKEYYFFPRNTKLYIELSNNLNLDIGYKNLKNINTNKNDNIFLNYLKKDNYRKLIIKEFHQKNIKKIIEINNLRIQYLLKNINEENFFVSDPNFLDDYKFFFNKQTDKILHSYCPSFFSIIRDPVSSSMSLINMLANGSTKENVESSQLKKIFYRQYSAINDLFIFKKKFRNINILLVDFEELTKNTLGCVKNILNYLNINYSEITIPNNPNPGVYNLDNESEILHRLKIIYDQSEKKNFDQLKAKKYIII